MVQRNKNNHKKKNKKSKITILNKKLKKLEQINALQQKQIEDLQQHKSVTYETITKEKTTLPQFRKLDVEIPSSYDYDTIKEEHKIKHWKDPTSDCFKECKVVAYIRVSSREQNIEEQRETFRYLFGYYSHNVRYPEFIEYSSASRNYRERPVLLYAIDYCNRNTNGWVPKLPFFVRACRVTRMGQEEGLEILSLFTKKLRTVDNYNPFCLQKFLHGLMVARILSLALSSQMVYFHTEKRNFSDNHFGAEILPGEEPVSNVARNDIIFPYRKHKQHPGNKRLYKIIQDSYNDYRTFRSTNTCVTLFYRNVIHQVRKVIPVNEENDQNVVESEVKCVKERSDGKFYELGDQGLKIFISDSLTKRYNNRKNK